MYPRYGTTELCRSMKRYYRMYRQNCQNICHEAMLTEDMPDRTARYVCHEDMLTDRKSDENVDTGRFTPPPPHPTQTYAQRKKNADRYAGPVFGPIGTNMICSALYMLDIIFTYIYIYIYIHVHAFHQNICQICICAHTISIAVYRCR